MMWWYCWLCCFLGVLGVVCEYLVFGRGWFCCLLCMCVWFCFFVVVFVGRDGWEEDFGERVFIGMILWEGDLWDGIFGMVLLEG